MKKKSNAIYIKVKNIYKMGFKNADKSKTETECRRWIARVIQRYY